jgi:tetratricopeptide (TPR) repeat protein
MKKIAVLLGMALLLGACDSDKRLFQEAKLATSQGKLTQAIQIYGRLIKKNPRHFAAYTNRGILWERVPVKDAKELVKNRSFAEEDYLKSLEINPRQPETYNNLGALYLDSKNYNGAIFNFTQALAFRPNYFMALMNRGIAYSRMGDMISALADFSKAEKISVTEPLLFLNRGLAYYEMGQYESAVSDFSRVLDLDPDNARAYLERARALIKLQYPADAYSDLETAVALKPSYALAYYYLGDLTFRRGEKEQALAFLVRSKELASKYVPTYELMGDMLAMEDPIAAVANYQVALKLDPAHAKRYERKMELMKTEEGRDRVLGNRFFPR